LAAVRIGYLTGTYPAVSHTFIMREVDGLRAAGLDVTTFSVHRPGPAQLLTPADTAAAAETPAIQPVKPGVVLRAHVRALRSGLGRYLRTFAVALRMSPPGARTRLWHAFYFAEAIVVWSWCQDRGISHVHAHFANAASTICMFTAEFGREDGMTWSFTMHGPTEFDDVTLFLLGEKVRRARFTACISDYARSQLMKLVEPEHWSRLPIVHCGVDPSRFAARPRPDEGPPRVLCVGRLVPDKGQALLIRTVAELRSRDVPVELVLVGDGPQRAELEQLAAELGVADDVVFAGAVGQDRIRDHLAACDVFCLPSFAEGVPVSLMEAMAMERPVVTTRIMGIPELVQHEISGRLVPPGRVDALVAALSDLLADEELRRRMGEAGRARVVEEYDIRDAVAALRAIYDGRAPAPATAVIA
jgi:glycosyltransferase involved in cell wall biosynthesis